MEYLATTDTAFFFRLPTLLFCSDVDCAKRIKGLPGLQNRYLKCKENPHSIQASSISLGMRFSSVFVLASLVVSSFASTAADVKADIVDIAAKLDTLATTVSALPLVGGTLSQALAIHTSAGPLIAASNKGAANADNVSPRPLSIVDGRAILDSVQALEPSIYHTLNGIVDRKNIFSALPVPALALPVLALPAVIKVDLENWNTATQALGDGWRRLIPADILRDFNDSTTRIAANFGAAIAAFP
ncbi:hypothetical protein DXG03_001789 [Asterophora parasitica]|uniref:Uncharacterized protein n=1 Tax=Asterophora parasitica TaxID=117018 RepID=A0A9P7FXN2_9AGAR|nr:hypothetical protein DXG03_001789 [Asterophora parasitica]